jgi:hypothetical protein
MKAEVFSNHYKSVFIHDTMTSQCDYQSEDNINRLSYIHFTPEKVLKAMKNGSSSIAAGPDQLPPFFLKNVADGIAFPLSIIFQHSLEKTTLPTHWLQGTVIPIYKGKGKDSDKSSYRPISLTSAPCKTMETIVKDEILQFLLQEGKISNHQHGFLSKRSTQTQLLECLNEWTGLIDAKNYIDVLYIDIAKAFDTVSHSILLKKLANIGISGKLLAWIKRFLTERSQSVKVGDHLSGKEEVTSGVPQGSVLGPLLFLIFIDDISQVVANSGLKIFADDTKVYFKTRHDTDHRKFTYDARKVFGWAHNNRLDVAMHKCQVLHLGSGNPQRLLSIGGNVLETTSSIKDLGVIMSQTLKFTEHINAITRAAYQRTGLIFKCFITRDREFLTKMFTSFCRPKLEYNTCVWSPHKVGEITQLENVQRRFTKRIHGLHDLTYAERLNALGLRSLEYRRIIFDLCMTFSICNNLVNLNFDDFFTRSPSLTTRGHEWKLLVPMCNCDTRKFFFSVRTVPVWNSLPSEAVTANNLDTFKRKLENVNLDIFLKFPEYNSTY